MIKWFDFGALFTPSEKTKLAGIETAADVTDTTNVLAAGSVNRIALWIEAADMWTPQTVGVIPANSFIIRAYIDVTVLFNDSGSDTIRLGITGDPDKFATATDVSSTGLKDPTRASGIGYNSTEQTVKALYEAGTLDANTGKALVVFEYYSVPAEP